MNPATGPRNVLGECLQNLADASNSNSDAITKLTSAVETLAKRIEALEQKIEDHKSEGGSGTGHYGGGPWG